MKNNEFINLEITKETINQLNVIYYSLIQLEYINKGMYNRIEQLLLDNLDQVNQ